MFKDSRNILGIVLILAGAFLALEQFDLIPGSARDGFFGVLLAIAAIALLSLFLADRSRWWAVMVGCFVSGLALVSLLGTFLPEVSENLGGPIFLGFMGLGFLSVFTLNREMWWALIPGGVMFSLAAVAYFESLPGNLPFDPAGLLFIGLGITFIVLSTVKVGNLRLGWGVYPGIPLLLFGLMLALGSEALWSYIGPLMLIAGGAWLLYSSLRNKSGA